MRALIVLSILCAPMAWCESQYTVMYQSFRLYGEVPEALRPATEGAAVVSFIDEVPVMLLPQLSLTTLSDGSLAWQGSTSGDAHVEAIAEAKKEKEKK